jgi:hypothetical protein
MSTLFSLGGLAAHPQNPHTWKTSLSHLVWLLPEMRFVRNVKGYTRPDKIRSEIIVKEVEIYGIQEVSTTDKQNWINHLAKMDNTTLPKHALIYQPRGTRDRGRPGKRWPRVDARTGQTT